jgi:hypothetical protein
VVPFCGTADTSQHHCAVGAPIEFLHGFSPSFETGMSIDTSEAKLRLTECLLNQIKHSDPTTEYHAAFSQLDVIFPSSGGVVTCLFLGLRSAPAAVRSCSRFPNNASTLAEG